MIDRDIQRVPAGLANVLNTFGGITPQKIDEKITGCLELLAFYGLNQRQVVAAANGAIASSATLDLPLNPNAWGVLFGWAGLMTLTATITVPGMLLQLQRGNTGVFQQVQFGEPARTAGVLFAITNYFSHPVILPPNSTLRLQGFFATDATAAVTMSAEVGIFG